LPRWPLLAAVLLSACERAPSDAIERKLDSAALAGVAILPTFDSPIRAGKSAVWCASFQIAWNRLARDVIKGPPRVGGAEELCKQLDRQVATEQDLPPGSFYAAAGWAMDGIVGRIRKEMAAAFPAAPPPDLAGQGAMAVAYAYLEAGVKFPIPFFESRKPLVFTDSSGQKTEVTSFGLREEDEYAYKELRDQAEVLFAERSPEHFAIDPCRSSAVQIILARIPPRTTLGETVAMAEEKIAGFTKDEHSRRIGIASVLLIPNIAYKLLHHFKELEGRDKPLLNSAMNGMWIEDACQVIRFRLDRSGAQLASEAKIEVPLAPLQDFIFDRPFLVVLRNRGGRPFFAAWIDGPELLQPW
jgi:hypothetical protein